MAARKVLGVPKGVAAPVVAGVGEPAWTRGVGDEVAIEEVEVQAGNVTNARAASHGLLMPVPTVRQRLGLPLARSSGYAIVGQASSR
jgi:hypothetical protein